MEENEFDNNDGNENDLESAEAAEENSADPVVGEEQLLELAEKEGLFGESAVTVDAPQETAAEPAAELSPEARNNLMASMETILFMSDKPVSLPKLRSLLDPGVPLGVFRELMTELRAEYARDSRGIDIAEVSLGFQLRTKPQMTSVLRKLVKTQPLKLSPATLETLAVVAYKQPVTKDELDQIRGVDSGYVLRNLMEKRLVRISGRSELPGRPMLYGTTHEFLELFSLKDLKALPALHEVESMVASSEVGELQQEEAALADFSKMVTQSNGPLFLEGELDSELEEIKQVISDISTSTPFIEEQKMKEKIALMQLENGGVLPDGTVTDPASLQDLGLTVEAAQPAEISAEPVTPADPQTAVPESQPTEHQPSPELLAQAESERWERHSAMIAEAIAEGGTGSPSPEAGPENKLVPDPEKVV